jgi:hypothetical protein
MCLTYINKNLGVYFWKSNIKALDAGSIGTGRSFLEKQSDHDLPLGLAHASSKDIWLFCSRHRTYGF